MRRTDALAAAVRRRQWEIVALRLLIGVAEAARKAPPETIEQLLALLAAEGEEDPRDARR